MASLIVLIAAAAIVRRYNDKLLKAERPVMNWVLDGTDTSGWDIANVMFESWIIIVGIICLSVATFFFNRRVAFVLPILMVFGMILGAFTGSIVGRFAPQSDSELSSFPNPEIVRIGVFLSLLLLVLWWAHIPKLVWQIGLEVATVALLVAAINRVAAGVAWPSDIVGSALVVGVTTVTGAILLERLPPRDPRKMQWAQMPRRISSAPSA